MNRTQKFATNAVIAAISQAVVMIAGFITPRVMISTYGSELNGLVSSLTQFISYITLVEAGIGGAAIYSLYKPLATNDEHRISSIVTAAQKSYIQAGYFFSTGVFILAIAYGFLRSSATLSFTTIFFLTIFLGANGCLDFFLLSGYRVLLTADQKNYVISGITTLQTILRTGIICLFSMYKMDVVNLYAIALVPIFLKSIAILVYGKKAYPYLDKNAKPDNSALQKRWDVIYQQILGTVQTGAPTIIATVLIDLKLVSVFTVYNMIVSGINGILNIFISGLPAGFGELIAKNEKDTLKKSIAEFEVAYYILLSVIYGVAFVMILPFIKLYTSGFTDVNYFDPWLAFFIVLNGLLYNIKTPQSMMIISSGMYKETRWHVTIQGGMIVVFGFVLGIPFGLNGILIGSCLSNLYRTIDLLVFVPTKITHTRIFDSLRRMLYILLSVFIIVLPSIYIHINVTGYFGWIIWAVGYCVYAVVVSVVLAYLFDRPVFNALLDRIKRLFFRGAQK